MLNSHRPPDTIGQSCLSRVWRGGVNLTIALIVFRTSDFIFSVGDSLELSGIQFTRRSGRDTDKTVACKLAFKCYDCLNFRCYFRVDSM